MNESAEKLRTAFRTPHMPVILQGEPVLALEAGAASLIAREDVVLNLVSGVYGAGFGFWAQALLRRTPRDPRALRRGHRSGAGRRAA